MNVFYAPPSQINNGFIELLDQEAAHATKVLRASEGDSIEVVDGKGGWYNGYIRRITKKSVQIEIAEHQQKNATDSGLVLGMGIIKKRDRLEFAIEKAVELGVSQIWLFRSEHTVKENVRMDRLKSIAIAAMKQSLRAWLPEIVFYPSFKAVLSAAGKAQIVAAHEKVDINETVDENQVKEKKLLLVGPEGGFSDNEVNMLTEHNARMVSLGSNRLRTETAALALLSQFL
jgi:16S rRNA (uracil1498-N3)-methyltransferase